MANKLLEKMKQNKTYIKLSTANSTLAGRESYNLKSAAWKKANRVWSYGQCIQIWC